MITITITGERGEGKTTTALAIACVLKMMGMSVKYEGYSPNSTEAIEGIIREKQVADMFVHFKEFKEYQIIDKDRF